MNLVWPYVRRKENRKWSNDFGPSIYILPGWWLNTHSLHKHNFLVTSLPARGAIFLQELLLKVDSFPLHCCLWLEWWATVALGLSCRQHGDPICVPLELSGPVFISEIVLLQKCGVLVKGNSFHQHHIDFLGCSGQLPPWSDFWLERSWNTYCPIPLSDILLLWCYTFLLMLSLWLPHITFLSLASSLCEDNSEPHVACIKVKNGSKKSR